jgi:hypothetical protein
MARGAALAGALAEIGVATVLAILEMERRTGVITLRGRDRGGTIALREGRVVRAELEAETSRSGREALYELLGWGEGRFHFFSVPVEGEDQVNLSTTQLLLEAARRVDETATEAAVPSAGDPLEGLAPEAADGGALALADGDAAGAGLV